MVIGYDYRNHDAGTSIEITVPCCIGTLDPENATEEFNPFFYCIETDAGTSLIRACRIEALPVITDFQ